MFGKEKNPDLEIFTIFDHKAQCYEVPTFAKNKNILIRELINLFQDPRQTNNKFLLNAEDFAVFKIASYSNETGKVTSQEPEHVANLHDLRAIAIPDYTPFKKPEEKDERPQGIM